MENKEIRRVVTEYAEDAELEIIFLDNASFDNSIVGVSSDGRLIYDYNKMVEELAVDDNISVEDAVEYIQFNTMRALNYMGENAPIIFTDLDTLKERY